MIFKDHGFIGGTKGLGNSSTFFGSKYKTSERYDGVLFVEDA